MGTHQGILKMNEFFNLKMSSEIDNIKIVTIYQGNFGNKEAFKGIELTLKSLGYTSNSNLETLINLYEAIRSGRLDDKTLSKVIGGSNYLTSWNSIKTVYNVFYKIIDSGNKISFSDRTRYNELFCIYLDGRVVIKTNKFKNDINNQIYREVIQQLINSGIFMIKTIDLKVDQSDLYQVIYENDKKTISNLNSRGYSLFSIASYFYEKNQSLTPFPFLNSWGNLNFFKALMSSRLFERNVPDEIKNKIPDKITFWSVLSEQSLLTNKVLNIDPRRKIVNQVINEALNSEAEEYLKELLYKIKLIQSKKSEETYRLNTTNNPYKEIVKILKSLLEKGNTKLPSKEQIVSAMRLQFILAKIKDYDFSSKRKDHLILDKDTRKRVFDIL